MAQEYVYETHLHTCQGSACGKTPGKEYIKAYMDQGYAGIIITDHFYRGNCRVDRSLPWPEFIHNFCSGYEDARNEGEKIGFPVFFGWEEFIGGDEYLIYGLDEAFMIEHPEMPTWTRKQQYEIVHAAGGCVVQAHPFRARDYIPTIYLSPSFVDGVEGFNAANEMRWNSMAVRYAERLGIPYTAGSDNHHAEAMKKSNLAGVVFDHPLTNIGDYVKAILNHEPFGLHLPEPIPEWTPDIQPELPFKWLNDQEQQEQIDLTAFLLGNS